MTVNPFSLPASLQEQVEATATFRAAQALVEQQGEPEEYAQERARLAKRAREQADAARWLIERRLLSYARPLAREALAAACAAAVLNGEPGGVAVVA
jgi:hypothetical protein